jgi:hypothetical protein
MDLNISDLVKRSGNVNSWPKLCIYGKIPNYQHEEKIEIPFSKFIKQYGLYWILMIYIMLLTSTLLSIIEEKSAFR